MNLPLPTHEGGVGGEAGGVGIGVPLGAPPATSLTVGSVGFGSAWTAEDSLAASNVQLHYALDEANARVAVLEEEQKILQRTIESLRDQLCADKCRDKAAADGGWANI